jgi:hypothetical protein
MKQCRTKLNSSPCNANGPTIRNYLRPNLVPQVLVMNSKVKKYIEASRMALR